MRIIESSWRATAMQDGHLTPEHQEKILAAVNDGTTLRSSTAEDGHGNTDTSLTLVEYTSPLGVTRRAVAHTGPDGYEKVDFDDDTAAEAHYEAEVRALAATGPEPVWDDSDVDGVPLIPYAWTVLIRPPGEDWQVARTRKARLGDRIDDRIDSTPATLEQAAAAHLAEAVSEQSGRNAYAALCEAVGALVTDVVSEAIRIEVTGDAGHGETTLTVQEDVALHVPTPQQVADFRQTLEQLHQEQEQRDLEEWYAYPS
ncbi:hypothetical protein [Streptosporangium canum]|uniref:hypothetical protein n=1 Tax=Streptosporangium canum TaxID=324952 RepID=UPI0037AE8DC6